MLVYINQIGIWYISLRYISKYLIKLWYNFYRSPKLPKQRIFLHKFQMSINPLSPSFLENKYCAVLWTHWHSIFRHLFMVKYDTQPGWVQNSVWRLSVRIHSFSNKGSHPSKNTVFLWNTFANGGGRGQPDFISLIQKLLSLSNHPFFKDPLI